MAMPSNGAGALSYSENRMRKSGPNSGPHHQGAKKSRGTEKVSQSGPTDPRDTATCQVAPPSLLIETPSRCWGSPKVPGSLPTLLALKVSSTFFLLSRSSWKVACTTEDRASLTL